MAIKPTITTMTVEPEVMSMAIELITMTVEPTITTMDIEPQLFNLLLSQIY